MSDAMDPMVSDLLNDIEVLRAERDALALEVSELKRRERIRESNSLSDRVFYGLTGNEGWNIFDLAKVLSCLHNAWQHATTCDLPRGTGEQSELLKITHAMHEALRFYLKV